MNLRVFELINLLQKYDKNMVTNVDHVKVVYGNVVLVTQFQDFPFFSSTPSTYSGSHPDDYEGD